MKRRLPIIPALFLLLGNLQAATNYVGSAATGSGNGVNWTNVLAWASFTPVRGNTYYVMDGDYTNKTFDVAASGTTPITIKKASATEHGTDTGWISTMGDGQAVFEPGSWIRSPYFVFDGSYRNEADWFDGAAYGFKITSNSTSWGPFLSVHNQQTTCPNVLVKYLFIDGRRDLPSYDGANTHGIDCANGSTDTGLQNTNYLFQRCYIRGTSNPYFVRNTYSPIIEYCAAKDGMNDGDGAAGGAPEYHLEVANLFYHTKAGSCPIVRYCHFRDTGVDATWDGATGVFALANVYSAKIYGNIIENYQAGNGVIAAGWDNNNIKFFNNTVIGGVAGPIVHFPVSAGSGNEAYNNIHVNCASTDYNGLGTWGSNSTLASSIFVNFASRDFRLATNTLPGRNLGQPYNVDMLGQARDSDGNWDRGAYEFNSGYTNIDPPLITSGNVSDVVSNAISYQIAYTGGTATNFGAVNLPVGLSLGSTNLITGTVLTPVTNTVTLSCTNDYGWTQTNKTFAFGPVPIASTNYYLGNTNNSATTDNFGNNEINGLRHTATADFTLSNIWVKCNLTGRFKTAIYSDSNSLPGTLLAQTLELTNSSGWKQFPLTNSVAVTNGGSYWLCFWATAAGTPYYTAETYTGGRYGARTYGAWPTNLTLASAFTPNYNYCVYAEGLPPAILGPDIDNIWFFPMVWSHDEGFQWEPTWRGISWTTLQPANSIVDVIGDASYTNASMDTAHYLTIVIQNPLDGFTAFWVRSIDEAGNLTTKGEFIGLWNTGVQRLCCNPVGEAQILRITP